MGQGTPPRRAPPLNAMPMAQRLTSIQGFTRAGICTIGLSAIMVLLTACSDGRSNINSEAHRPGISVISDSAAQRVDVLVDGEPFTSYLYSDTISVLKKPVLYPIRTAEGIEITRGYPIHPKPGESIDHPHQIGLWMNYGAVNGFDFWNNSDAVPEERQDEVGTIRHLEVVSTADGRGVGELVVAAEWRSDGGEPLLHERTEYVFHADSSVRIIDRISRLTALEQRVSFEDNKEGLLGLRLTRALEVTPSRSEGSEEVALDVPEKDAPVRSGAYRNSEGVSGYPDVWGRRARWTTLTGLVEGQNVTVAVIDHPDNVGYPTYWHTRDYGLFAANPLGQAAFTDGEERLDFVLDARESTTFRFRIVIFDGIASGTQVDDWFADFAGQDLKLAPRK